MHQALKFGIVSDSKPGFAKIYFEEDDLVTDWWPLIVNTSMKDKESWPLNTNEHVACLCGERCEEGVIIGAIHSDPEPADSGGGPGKFRKIFEDGTLIEYDKNAHKLTIDVKGELDAKATGDVNIETTGNLKATATLKATVEAPDVEVTATVTAKITSPLVTIDGVLAVTGALSAATIATTGGGAITSTGDISTTGTIQGAQVKAGAIDLSTHKHSGVQTGSGVSGVPV